MRSLSKEEIIIGMPCLEPRSAKEAITSSASTFGISITGIPMALQISFNGESCSLKSSGIGGRLAL